MKKITVLLFVVASLFSTTICLAQKSDSLRVYVKKCIEHAIPFEKQLGLQEYLLTLAKNEIACGRLADEVKKDLKDRNIECIYAYTKNFLDFTFVADKDFKVKYHVVFTDTPVTPNVNSNAVRYYYKSWHSFTDKYLAPGISHMLINSPDNPKEFELYTNVIANLMKYDFQMPLRLQTRVIADITFDEGLMDTLHQVFLANGFTARKLVTQYLVYTKYRGYVIYAASRLQPIWLPLNDF